MTRELSPYIREFHKRMDSVIADRKDKIPGGMPDWYEDQYRTYMGLKLVDRELDGDLELQRKFRDPKYLPSREEVMAAFKNKDDIYNFGMDVKDDVKDNPYEVRNVHEILTREYIEALASHIADRIIEIKDNVVLPVRILEVGGGDGRLTHHLQVAVQERLGNDTNAVFIATDLEVPHDGQEHWSEEMSYEDALKQFNPHVVISSWMPPSQDWTADFRKTKSVQEYIMLGEFDCVADPYGAESWDDHDDFKGSHIKEAEKNQVCYLDEPWKKNFKTRSQTMSFQREMDFKPSTSSREIKDEAQNILELHRYEPEMAQGMIDDAREWSKKKSYEPERRKQLYGDWDNKQFSELVKELNRLARIEGIKI
ncbi:MAG: hypothetical protein ABIA47_01285 [bacterium]